MPTFNLTPETSNPNALQALDKQLHCIDFDGTISKKDSFLGFITFTKGAVVLYFLLLLLSPVLITELLFPRLAGKTKQLILSILFKGESRSALTTLGVNFFKEKLIHDIRPQAKAVIDELIQNKHEVVIVSASVDIWLQSVANYLHSGLICTKAEYKNEKFTGRFCTSNCKGAEKVNRIRQQFTTSEYYITSYGNSTGDKEMLALADKKLLHPFV